MVPPGLAPSYNFAGFLPMTERMLFIIVFVLADGGALEAADGEFAPISGTEATTRTYVCPQGLTVSTSRWRAHRP